MKITCPNCTTSYQVPDGSIRAEGRTVKCATCGEKWHAEPEPDDAAAPEALEDADKEQSQDDIDALFDSPSGGEEQSQDDIDALFDSPSGGEEQSQDDIDALFDSPSGGKEQSQDDIDSLFDSPSGGEEQSQDDVDALFGGGSSGDDEEEVVKSSGSGTADPFVVSADKDQLSGSEVVDMMNAASFEAQKALAQGKDIESKAGRGKHRLGKGKSKKGEAQENSNREWAIGSVALGCVLAIVIGLFAAPKFWVRTFPDLASFYGMIGMSVNVAGVDIDTVNVKLLRRAGSPVISVDAELVNPEADPVLLPAVEFSVLGKDDDELYSWAIEPDKTGLGPGEHKRIQTSVAAPSNAQFIYMRVFHQ
ncbi:zinc-ribbon domain-containing protein [uncultured Cohaesibacter sp.]|uniref:zinc-ribbon domain-containing protein n=1 Tax=uncultured Cohaesibacter sp. TaxID=1002546 RepID=UPI0029C7F0EC|nr:zinc-ribbon domain-containing protein [uncultured Cohaesibacter sp.]